MGGYWAFRALVFGVCATILVVVIATACTQDPAVRFISPTLIPSLTLTLTLNRALSPPFTTLPPAAYAPDVVETVPLIYLAQEHDTLEQISEDFGLAPDALQTANPQFSLSAAPFGVGQRVIIPQVTPNIDLPALILPTPHCIPTEPENLLCLGSVFNVQPQAITDVMLRVMLTRDDDTVIAQVVTVTQRNIPPQSSAAYTVRFVLPPQVLYQDVVVTLISAQPTSTSDAASLTVDASPPRIVNGRYVLSATIANTSARTIDSVRVYATVYDASAQVVGHRVFTVGRLDSNAAYALVIDVPLVSMDGPLRLELYSEAGW